jgi:hypothetical protein
VVGFGPWPGDCELSPPIYGAWGSDALTAYKIATSGQFAYMTYIKGAIDGSSCAPQPTEVEIASQDVNGDGCSQSQSYSVSVTTTPANPFSNKSTSAYILYEISTGDNIITVNVSGLLDNSLTSAIGVENQSGGGSISASVYSTSPRSVTSLDQITDIYGDGTPRLDPDDTFTVGLNAGQNGSKSYQGNFQVSVYQDKTTTQTDNFGNTFHPYKVRIQPLGAFHQEYIPSQPPQRL